MPNIPPLITSMPNSQPLYATYAPLPMENASSLTWTANTPGTNSSTATITVPGVTATSVVVACVQSGTYADTNDSWLMAATPGTGTITFKVYTKPVTPVTFTIAFAVMRL